MQMRRAPCDSNL